MAIFLPLSAPNLLLTSTDIPKILFPVETFVLLGGNFSSLVDPNSKKRPYHSGHEKRSNLYIISCRTGRTLQLLNTVLSCIMFAFTPSILSISKED